MEQPLYVFDFWAGAVRLCRNAAKKSLNTSSSQRAAAAGGRLRRSTRASPHKNYALCLASANPTSPAICDTTNSGSWHHLHHMLDMAPQLLS